MTRSKGTGKAWLCTIPLALSLVSCSGSETEASKMDWDEACEGIFSYKLPEGESDESPDANAVEYRSRDHAHTISETNHHSDQGSAAELLRGEKVGKEVVMCALEGERSNSSDRGVLKLSYKKTAKNEIEKPEDRQGDREAAVIGMEENFLFRARSRGVGLVESEFECKRSANRSTVVIAGKLDDDLLLIDTNDRLRILANSMRLMSEGLECAEKIDIANVDKMLYAPRDKFK